MGFANFNVANLLKIGRYNSAIGAHLTVDNEYKERTLTKSPSAITSQLSTHASIVHDLGSNGFIEDVVAL